MNLIFEKDNRFYWMGVAIFLIILCHIQYTCIWNDVDYKILRLFFRNGDIGVEIFLLISVYGLCHSYETRPLSLFYKNRFKRIYPMYLLFLLIGYLFIDDSNILLASMKQITGYNVIGGNQFNEWYIPALTLIYVFFPLFFKGTSLIYKKSQYGCYILIFIFIISYGFTSHYIVPYFARRFYLIVLSIFIYLSQKSNKEHLTMLIFIALLQIFTPTYWGNYLYLPLILYAIDSLKPKKMPLKSLFTFLGKYSLEIYLAQTIGIIFFCSYYDFNPRIKMLCGIVLTVVIAFLLHHFHLLCLRMFKIK